MTKIAFSPYELIAKTTIHGKVSHAKRQGALLRCTFDNGVVGYADCHPWVEANDLPLEQQLNLLQHQKTTALTDRSLHFARLDATARQNKKHLLANLKIPLSHRFIPDLLSLDLNSVQEAFSQGFTHFKVKLGSQLDKELPKLMKLLKWCQLNSAYARMDFNSMLSRDQFMDLYEKLSDFLPWIDFFEDPFKFDKSTWHEGLRLACDRESLEAIQLPYTTLVIKPAVQTIELFFASSGKMVVTSYLDHPVGQVFAAYSAGVLAQRLPKQMDICGLLSHHAYEPNAFSKELSQQGPIFAVPSGYGIGFDELLKEQSWQTL